MSERDELLLALSASCQAHKEQQHSSPELQQDTIPPKCKNDLETLRQLLPRVEDSFNPREDPHPAHAMHLCDFYLSMLSGLFCPHFRGLFRCDKNTNEVLPRVQLLLEYLVSRPLCQAATNSDLFAPCVKKIAITIARLLCLIPMPSSCIVHDLVTLCIDLAAVDESNVVNDKQTVSVSMLPETSKPWGPEKQLKVSNEDALSVLKGVLPQILIEFSVRAEETDMNHVEIGASPQAQPVAHTTCTALSGWCVSVMLGACRQTFQRAGSKSIKSMRIQTEAKISFGSFLSKLRSHWNQTGPPSVSLICHTAIVVVRAVTNHLRMTAVTPRVARLADLSQLLINLLCGFVLYPPTIHGRSSKGVSSICWSCCMQPLLECLRNAASIHEGGDGAELLHTVLCTIHIMLSFDQSAAGHFQGNRLSAMAYGHCAKNGLFPDLVALLGSKRSSRAAVHIIGIMSGLVGRQKEPRRKELHFAIALCVQRYRRENKGKPQEVEASPKGKRRRSQPSPADRTKTPPLDLVLSPKRRKSNSASSPKVCRRALFSNGDRHPSPASQSLTDALVSKLSLCCTYLVRNSKSHQLNVSETKELDLCLGVFCLLYLMLSKSTTEEFEPLKRDTDWLFEMGCHVVKREHAKFHEAGSSPLDVPPTWWQGIVDIGLLSRFCLNDADFQAARGAPTSMAKLVATLVWQHVLQLGRQDVVDDRLRTSRADFASRAISWMTQDVAKLGKKGNVTGFPSCLYGAGAYRFWDETHASRPRHCDGIAIERLFNLELDIKVALLATLLPGIAPPHQIGEESKEGGVVQNGSHALGCLAYLLRARETAKSAPPLAIVNLYALAPLMAFAAAVPMEGRFSQDIALGHSETFRNTISGLLRAFPIEGFIMIAENDTDPLAQQAALLACRRLCGFKPIVRSPMDVNADFIYQWITDPTDTIVTAQGESCFRDAQFVQLLSADYSRDEETGPGTWSMLASAAMRTRSNDIRRLASGRSIAKNEKNSASVATAIASPRKLGTIQWLLSAPFSDSRYALRLRASKAFGELLLGNNASILFAVFGQDEEFDAFQRNVGEHHRTDFHSDNHSASVVSRIFQEIDTILYRHCFVPQSQLSFTVATTSHSSGESTGGVTDSRSHALVRARYHYTAVRSFASLCQKCAAVATTSLGKLVFELALLRLVRFWAMFFRLGGVEDGAEVCISALAYRELRKLSMMGMLEGVVAPCGKETFSPGLFSDMLLPAANFVLSDAAVSSAARAQQFRLFAGFISTFLVKIQSATVVPGSKGAARMLHINLSARSMDLVIDHVDDCIRFVFPVFILEKDYDTLRLTTAFKLFLLGEKRNIEKGRERSYVGSTFNELSRTRTSRKKQPDLDEQTMNLCLSPDKIEHVLPRLLMYHEDRSQLVFFLQTVLRKRISLSQMINKRDELVLKSIVWELGGEDSGARAIQALKTAAIAKQHIGRERPLQEESAEDAATIWVSSHFMYLLVNVVQYRWKQRTTRDKMKALRSLGVMLHFLVPSEAQQFVPQILATVCMAFDVRSNIEDQQTLRLLAVQAMSQYVRLLTEENCDVAGKNLATMVVTLLPVLSAKASDFPTPKSRQAAKEAERVAVELFNVLTSGTLGRQFAPYFKDLPFLPATAGLLKIRENLKGHNVDLDSDFLLVSTQDSQPSASARESIASGSSIDEPSWLGANMERALLKRLSVLCPLLPHESASVRLVAVEKITELVRSNRSLFFRVLKRQEETSQHHFLTVDFKEVDRGSVVGICDAIESLLRRCVAERDSRCRNALATCVGEIGAVDSNRLATLRIRSAFAKGTKGRSWLLSNPPWQSIAARYELELLTHHLVTSLRAATSSVDQHKIAFTIQQLLVDLDRISRLGGREKRVTSSLQKGGDGDHSRGNMTVWLRDHLHQAGVLETIETYWHSKFSEIEPFSARTPPFFSRSSSYFGWISHWCRYMITRARDGSRSQLHNLFYSCRTAIRSSAGLSVAEFILPLLILDRLCFGDKSDEKMIEEEFCSVLSHPFHGTGRTEGIEQNDVPKAVKTVFMALDTLEWWAEHEVEDQHRRKRSGGSTRPETVQMFGSAAIDSCWPVDRSIDAIGKVLTLVPLSLRARAAMSCDMHARSLRYVELAARNEGVESRFDTASVEPATKDVCREAVESTHLAGVDTQILKEVLEGLADYETLNGLDAISGTWQGWESITEKEANGDWMGAWNLCERAIQLSRDRGEKTKLETVGLRCLLHLGQFETVLKQANGILERNRVYGQQEGADPSRESEYLVLPFATEAAWQLGQWDDLERMLERDATFKQRTDHCEIFRVSVGRAMLGLRDGSEDQVRSAIEQGRRALMNGLAQLASESYARAYPALVRLHSLREIEDALHVLSLRDGCNESRPSISAMTASGGQGSLDWDTRLQMVSPVERSSIVDVRLGLARILKDSALEGSLLYNEGRRLRKEGLHEAAATLFAKAENAFKFVGRDQSPSSRAAGKLMGNIQVQVAKIHHQLGRSSNALGILGNSDVRGWSRLEKAEIRAKVREIAATDVSQEEAALEHFTAKLVLSTKWMVESGLQGVSEIMERYRIAVELLPESEKGHFHFAKYVDSVLEARVAGLVQQSMNKVGGKEERNQIVCADYISQDYLVLSLELYLRAMTLNSKHVYQALPRLLSLWFEFNAMAPQPKTATSKRALPHNLAEEMTRRQHQTNHLVSQSVKSISPQAFYTVMPQLISRVTHANKETAMIVETILTRILTKFPSQAMWNLSWLRNSVNSKRSGAGERIFKEAQQYLNHKKEKSSKAVMMLTASKSLVKFLIDLAKFIPKDGSARAISLAPWKGEAPLHHFVPPIQAALSTPQEPGRSTGDHFPRIRTFCAKVGVMSSKARPKKLKSFVVPPGTRVHATENSAKHKQEPDIGELHFLVKNEAKGDLRKDARVQDLNIVINRLMASPGSGVRRGRRLHLRTFAVTCLSEDCGILEWVPHTESFRSLISKTYNPQASPFSTMRRGKRLGNVADPAMRQHYERCQNAFFKGGDLSHAASMFATMCSRTYPPLFYWWFVQNFMDPHAWYEARVIFTASAAVWSAVGHVIGLGDRHSENILIDRSTGSCVHVDFDCIFDKGLALPKPEVIPFRLTPNMLDAFGPIGANGMFSGSLQSAMSTLRNNKDTLLSVLEPFLNDPIIDWKRYRSQQKQNSSRSGTNREANEAKRSINVIDERLRGIYNLRNPNLKKFQRVEGAVADEDEDMARIIPLSVEGQVHKMISEATKHENLVQLYIGWMPWV